MTSQTLEYVTALVGVVSTVQALGVGPMARRLASKRRRRRRPPLCPAAATPPGCDAAEAALRLLPHLPAGTVVRCTSRHGLEITVWQGQQAHPAGKPGERLR